MSDSSSTQPKKPYSNVSPFMPKNRRGNMAARPPARPLRPSVALAAKKERDGDEVMAGTTAPTPDNAAPATSERARKSEQSNDDLQSQLDDVYNKLEERDAKIEQLEADVRAKAATIDADAVIKKNLEAELKQYAFDLKDKSELLVITQGSLVQSRTGQLGAMKELQKTHNNTLACFADAQNLADQLKTERDDALAANNKLHETIAGAQHDYQAMLDKVRECENFAAEFKEAKDFTDNVARELGPVFAEMGRQLNATNVLSHIHELQNISRQPRRKVDRKVSIADELAGHSDAESEDDAPATHTTPSQNPPTYDNNHLNELLPELTAEELEDAVSQVEANNAAEDRELAEKAKAETVARQQKMAEIRARTESAAKSSPPTPPVATFDWQKALNDAQERYRQTEATLNAQNARVAELEKAESFRRNNAIEADRAAAIKRAREQRESDEMVAARTQLMKDKTAAAQKITADKARIAQEEAAEKIRTAATDKIRIDAQNRADAVIKRRADEQAAAEAAEKIRLTEEVKTLTARLNGHDATTASNKDAEISRLTEEITKRDAEISRLVEEITNRDSKTSRLIDEVKTLTTRVATSQSLVDAQQTDAEKDRLTALIKTRDARIELLQDTLDELPSHQRRNQGLLAVMAEVKADAASVKAEVASEIASSLRYRDIDHAAAMKAKDAQIAEWQRVVDEVRSNNVLLQENPVYVEVLREKTTLEWLRDMPLWWQLIMSLLVLFLCMGNYSVWSLRHAWVTSNVFVMDHVRAVADRHVYSSNFVTIWLEDLIGFDRKYLG